MVFIIFILWEVTEDAAFLKINSLITLLIKKALNDSSHTAHSSFTTWWMKFNWWIEKREDNLPEDRHMNRCHKRNILTNMDNIWVESFSSFYLGSALS